MSKNINIETSTGFCAEIDPVVMNDMEVIDIISTVNIGKDYEKIAALSSLADKLLGSEDKKRLYDHVRDEYDRVPIERIENELVYILQGLGQKEKN